MNTKNWIRNPLFDLTMFGSFWWVPLSVAMFLVVPPDISVVMFFVFHIFIRLPHFAATTNFTYGYEPNLPHYKQHWFRYYAMPLIILLMYGFRSLGPDILLFEKILLTVAVIWGKQHIAFQHYGILSIYRGKTSLRTEPNIVKHEKSIFYALMGLAIIEGLSELWFGDSIREIRRPIAWTIRLYLLAAIASYVWKVKKVAAKDGIPWGLVAYFVTAISVMIYWPFYNTIFATPADGLRAYFYIYNGHHCLAYLGLMYHMDTNKGLVLGKATAKTEIPFKKYYLPQLAGSLVLMGITFWYWKHLGFENTVSGWVRAMTILDGVFIAHYYVDSVAWKFSQPHNRKYVLPLLR